MEKQVELVVLFGNEVERVWPLLDGFPFDDNGGEPDGPAWLAPAADFSPEELDAIIPKLGYIAIGVEIDGYDGSDEARARMKALSDFRWCGYSSRDVAYYIPVTVNTSFNVARWGDEVNPEDEENAAYLKTACRC